MPLAHKPYSRLAIGASAAMVACNGGRAVEPATPAHPPNVVQGSKVTDDSQAAHLKDFPGVYVRTGDEIKPAPEADQKVARGYPAWSDKGPLTDGRRITIMTGKTTAAVNEPIRVVHVVETVKRDDELYVMGPKQVYGEHLDGKLVTAALPADQDPLIPPGIYDGMVVASPAVDYNYEITTYRIASPGVHQIQWKLGALESNILRIDVHTGN